jgi:C_GCAxxG_C_C family probable redox protein
MSRAERAKKYFEQGYACSQAVALAFADVAGIDEDTITKIMLPFGGGFGRLRLTCGAVSGMVAVLGATCAKAENTQENKMNTYAMTQEICKKFKEENGSLICAELLEGVNVTVGGAPEARTAEYYKKRPCAEIVYSAAAILEKYLQDKGVL